MQSVSDLANLAFKKLSIKRMILLFFLCWTLFLVVETWKIQHSSNPMLSWSTVISQPTPQKPPDKGANIKGTKPTPPPVIIQPTPPPVIIQPTPQKKPDKGADIKGTKPTPPPVIIQPTPPPVIIQQTPQNTPDKGADIIGVGAGSLAIVGLAIAEAPVVVTVGVGVAIWFLVTTAVKTINGA